jgi:lipopolysaccharide/colanic/teichoic acid biosynthesis glycosyltransferase
MDQKEFQMFKFRTMTMDAEKEGSPQWTQNNDSRRTRLGAWLRRTSLDELPQLINVAKGQMSMVGPRPERPVFARQFSEEYKKYMFRHKVKAGMTGWAQIHGFRGDTSLRKRLLYDLYYVRNWSFGLDLWILARTPWHIIKGENAY